jgi:predicted CopG family antitoxin
MVDNPNPVSQMTSIIITTNTRDDLKACKHGGNTYDDVLKKLMKFHHEKTGAVIVE